MRTAAPLLAGLLLLAAVPGTAQSDPRGELLRLLNAERQKVGAPPLRLSPPLSRAAEEHAAELAARGAMRLQASSAAEMRQRLERAGYEAHAWTESLAMTPGDPETAIRNWRQGDAESYRRAMSPEFRDIGIGLDRLRGTPLYIFLFAVPESDYFARGTSGLGDLERVRAEVLARVNEARIKAGIAPLRANSRLDRAAQRHAEGMLARGYFAHQSPEGKTVRERAREADYDWRAIGENLAEGQFSADEVVDNWLHSPDHRRNILDPGFKEMGLGVARGRDGRRYRVLWAQVLGAR
ncbi:MAG TPA: CAP domain-containing protein [Thermoanaerobaculia bacterium]|jgi:uncharacterized protein YkwD|nr:CAP domain-containing protein [Thermoanaerobaculia bacterium]